MNKRPLIASPPWTPEEDDQLRAAAESGESIVVISKRLCRSEGHFVTVLVRSASC
jgi:hypothetical protein